MYDIYVHLWLCLFSRPWANGPGHGRGLSPSKEEMGEVSTHDFPTMFHFLHRHQRPPPRSGRSQPGKIWQMIVKYLNPLYSAFHRCSIGARVFVACSKEQVGRVVVRKANFLSDYLSTRLIPKPCAYLACGTSQNDLFKIRVSFIFIHQDHLVWIWFAPSC